MTAKRPAGDQAATGTDWFSAFAQPLTERAFRHLAGMTGSALALDLGCGRGERTASFGEADRIRWVGIDIDAVSLRFARAHATGRTFVRGDIERLPFRESSFDAIFSFSVLQYVDWQSVIAACRRLLKPGGRAVFIENLSANPFASGYRRLHRLAGWRYSPAQTPRRHLMWKDLDEFRNTFENTDISVFHLTTPGALIVPTLRNRILGNPGRIGPPGLLHTLMRLDRLLLTKMPFLRRFCWMAVVCAVKEDA
ncbi:MAG TPA: class I SAM-dependent methyltransferase [Acidobacteriota bacterium]|nr:class I SAM-dependent methyltransferase [Acidobacteriota bacterium]